jgi:hypothetical protein
MQAGIAMTPSALRGSRADDVRGAAFAAGGAQRPRSAGNFSAVSRHFTATSTNAGTCFRPVQIFAAATFRYRFNQIITIFDCHIISRTAFTD